MELAEETLEAYIHDLRYKLRYLEENEIWQIFIEVSFNYTLKLEPETRLCGIRSVNCSKSDCVGMADGQYTYWRWLEWCMLNQILLGLHFLHTNEHRILHRDISLCNILRVLQKGEDGKPDRFIHKLSDLGVARVSILDTDDIWIMKDVQSLSFFTTANQDAES